MPTTTRSLRYKISSKSLKHKSSNGRISKPKTTQPRKKLTISLTTQNNPLKESEYFEDICYYMHLMELQTLGDLSLIDSQPELDWRMRSYLIDFLIEVHAHARLRPETLYLAVNIIDRYVSRRVVLKKHYQLVGCAALWIAAKFEDAKHAIPCLSDLVVSCCGIYDESAFVQMESHILTTLGWVLGHPTAEQSWLRIFTLAMGTDDMQTQHIARCVMELSLYRREFIDIPSSSIAAGSLLLARTIVGRARKIVDEDQQSIQVAELLDSFLGEHLDQLSEIISAKYAPHYYSRASIIVREWYLAGKRFYFYAPVLSPSYVHNTPPPTPPFSQSSMETGMYSPGSSSSEDDAPLTPYSQAAPIPSLNVDYKENKQIIKPRPSIQSFTSLQISNKGV
ncbi:hypothetical protein E3Q23_02662 [Wallemia mellicola]|nr:hypothetical protein E3Q23_02662 [Wallemia mellicola]TIC04284.1 hypothetical protein E3Q16_02764 [Wallemia mellicola]TIC35672.1 hypothetical protein E3Q09_01998 [Wallemia mellicola]TIC54259.1 hypothetical protein E3Q04_02735 [Wallemia mellicola]